MGNTNDSASFPPDVASNFYWACRNGDVQKVTQLLPSMTYKEISALHPSGSTPLHAASFYGHAEIVKMLLGRGCDRSVINRYGLTAYQEAKTDEIRNLFKRPESGQSRYMSNNICDQFQLQQDNNDENIPDNWLRGHSSASKATDAQFVAAVHHSRLFRTLVQGKTEAENDAALQDLVKTSVINANDKESSKMSDLLEKFLQHGKRRVDHLIKMYTIESQFYTELHRDNSAFTSILYLHLHEYRDRAFKGYSYRGAGMTSRDIEAYQWAQKNSSRVLETCVLQSSSKQKATAEDFANRNRAPNKRKALLTYYFPENCDTAIALSQIDKKDHDRCLSDYEQEDEVLILPYTLFQVTDVEVNQQTGWCYIFLTNVPVPNKSVFTAWLQTLATSSQPKY